MYWVPAYRKNVASIYAEMFNRDFARYKMGEVEALKVQITISFQRALYDQNWNPTKEDRWDAMDWDASPNKIVKITETIDVEM